MESRLVRACGCVVDTAEDGAVTPAWCSEHANAAAVEMKPGAATALLEMETRVAELAAERTALTAEISQLQESLRMEWWANHGCSQSGMYGDDGERGCGICRGDFKKTPFSLLRTHVQETRNRTLVYALSSCRSFSPPWFTGRWRDWHRGHGCDLDDGRPRSPEAVAEIAKGGV